MVNVRAADQALRLPARSAVRTRQKNVHVHRPPEFPALGGMTTVVSGTAPRYRMKAFAKSDLVDTWNSYACTPEASTTAFHSSRPIRPLWNVAPSAGIVSTGGSAVRSPLASGSRAILVTNPSLEAPPPIALLDVGSTAPTAIGKSLDVVWPLTMTVLPETKATCGTDWKLSAIPPLPP